MDKSSRKRKATSSSSSGSKSNSEELLNSSSSTTATTTPSSFIAAESKPKTTTTTTTTTSSTSTPTTPKTSFIRTRSQAAAAAASSPVQLPETTTPTENKPKQPVKKIKTSSNTSTPISKSKGKSSTPTTSATTTTTTTATSTPSTPITRRRSAAANSNSSTPTTTSTTTTTSSSNKRKTMSNKQSSEDINSGETGDKSTSTPLSPQPPTTTTTTSTSSNNNNNNNSSEEEDEGTGFDNRALQGLMRNLSGSLLDELTPFRNGSNPAAGLINTLIEGRNRSKQLLAGLKSDDENKQMESLAELCHLLSIATEETIAGFPYDSFAPALINLLNMDYNPEMMILAGRALSNMIEALPSSVSSVINHGAVPMLCSKLLSIEYIDLAEQSLQTLEKISLEQPTAVLRAGGLMAVLSYLDFFSTGVQRMAVSTAANICRQIPQDCFNLVKESIPILTNLLQYSDQKVVELSCLCFSRLVDSFYDSSSNLEFITSFGLLPHLVRILSGMYSNTTTLTPTTYSQIIRVMANICHGCPHLTLILLQEGITVIIQTIMLPAIDSSSTSNAINRSNQQSYEILSLINELLPPLPSDFSNLLNTSATSSIRSLSRKKKDTSGDSLVTPPEDPRIGIYREHPELLVSLGSNLFVILVEMFTSTVNPSVRYKCLGSIWKILYFSTSDMIKDLLKDFGFSSFLASLLGSRDMAIVATALKIASLMMEKLSNIFDRYFKREGVVYEIDRLSKLEPIVAVDNISPTNEELSSTTTTSSSSGTSSTNPISIPTTPTRTIPPPLASSPFGNNAFFVGSPAIPSTPSASSSFITNSSNISSSTGSTSSVPISLTTTTTTTSSNSNINYPTTPEEYKTFVCKEARSFKDKFFPKLNNSSNQLVSTTTAAAVDDENNCFSTKELSILIDLGKKLNNSENEQGIKVLQEIKDMLTNKEGISAFEFLHSDLIGSMLSYLTRGNIKLHAECFSQVFLTPYQKPTSGGLNNPLKSSSPNPLVLSLLIEKLHDALNKVERFNICISEVSGTSTGLKYLTQPFKLKLTKEGDNENLKDYSSNVVLIEPLATITAIEEFLTSKAISTPAAATTSASATTQPQSSTTTSTASSTTPVASTTTTTKDENNNNNNNKKQTSDIMDEDEDEDDYNDYEDDELLNGDQNEPETETVHDVKLNELSTSGNFAPSNSPSSIRKSSTSTTTTTTTTTSTTSPTSTSSSGTSTTSSTPSSNKIGIFIDGQRLSNSMTIFQAVQKIAKSSSLFQTLNNNNNINGNQNNNNENDNNFYIPTSRLWEGTHVLKYRFLKQSEIDAPNTQSGSTNSNEPPIKQLGSSKLIRFLKDDHTFSLTSNDTTYEIIALLRCLFMFSSNPLENENRLVKLPLLNGSEFISQKLTAKIMRQLQDPLALCGGAFPEWCKQLLNNCSFLFPFDCKRLFFYSTSFGIARALSTLQQRQDLIRQTNTSSNNERGDVRVGRIQRQKVRIYRQKILESAIKVMELYGKSKSMLEVEYFGEVGTGLGPTLEFFTLVSREIQRKDLKMWYSNNDSSNNNNNSSSNSNTPNTSINENEDSSKTSSSSSPTTTTITPQYVYSIGGLFPQPMNPKSEIPKKLLDYFKFLGLFIAKAFFDQRLVDIPLSKPFYKYMINQELDFNDLRQIAPEYANSLNNLYGLVLKMKEINENRSDLTTDEQKKAEISKLTIEGAKIEDLCLDFVLPGFPGWELKPDGENIPVTLNNLEEYLNLILKNFLYSGVVQQFDAFKDGFNQILPISSLESFSIAEIESLLCGALTGSDYDWSIESLMDSTKADHGFTLSSSSVQNLFTIMSEFTPEERKQFLLFISGSPHLPLQGFKGLIPRLTIVKKHHYPPLTPDDYLLSVMSCTNYIKLPDYSSKEVMKEKLLYAMKEGQSSFHLS